ncbi:hypothetical protein WDU94_013822 [Cyamophila willieti]
MIRSGIYTSDVRNCVEREVCFYLTFYTVTKLQYQLVLCWSGQAGNLIARAAPSNNTCHFPCSFSVLKDEPEDLTHLAPTPGDACISLEGSSEFGLMGDLLIDEFILPEDNYCPLLSDACDSNSKQMSPCQQDDSFYMYRDDRSLSPDHVFQSPGQCSIPSLSSMEDSPPMVEDSMNSLWGLDLVDSSSEELCVRAPYIPMPHDDLPLLTAGDLMWGASIHKPAPLNSQDPLLSSHSKTMSW